MHPSDTPGIFAPSRNARVAGDDRDALAPMMDAFARSGRAIRDARAVRIASTSGARVAVER